MEIGHDVDEEDLEGMEDGDYASVPALDKWVCPLLAIARLEFPPPPPVDAQHKSRLSRCARRGKDCTPGGSQNACEKQLQVRRGDSRREEGEAPLVRGAPSGRVGHASPRRERGDEGREGRGRGGWERTTSPAGEAAL
jgi:hypothetical protein